MKTAAMRLRFLGKESNVGESPTLYASDQGTYIVQGYRVGTDLLESLRVPTGQTCVEIYTRLLTHLEKDGLVGGVRMEPPIVRESGDRCIVQGAVVSDGDTRSQMRIPDHEDCVEIPRDQFAALVRERTR
ncbi:hypothetical protein [Allonocardiopsis opalescens]|uniref:Uncharacterized protein n=1 Tax=Allonocardiopsis opalescens TaxID=1144618 RepID=A0A2T0PZ42_9ACTN|nr:hypothetical protein [Allonocardiopsis opalescens]PRX96677.1 hypothetical protein CLV72_107200 [Allonocardiopsis opalescens]